MTDGGQDGLEAVSQRMHAAGCSAEFRAVEVSRTGCLNSGLEEEAGNGE